jgi:uncharacterized membrane protein
MSVLDRIAGPLDKNSCTYFLITTLLFFFILILTLIGEVVYTLLNFKKINRSNFIQGVLILFNIFLAYFVNRLLLTMCRKSLD